jgi:hypothetical protein
MASSNNNHYILSFTEAFSMYVKLVAITEQTPEKVAKEIQCKPLNVLTSGQRQTDNINRMITITECHYSGVISVSNN